MMLRPKTRGELKYALEDGMECEVVASNEEITSILIDSWLGMQGKYKTRPSENEGWVVYYPIGAEA